VKDLSVISEVHALAEYCPYLHCRAEGHDPADHRRRCGNMCRQRVESRIPDGRPVTSRAPAQAVPTTANPHQLGCRLRRLGLRMPRRLEAVEIGGVVIGTTTVAPAKSTKFDLAVKMDGGTFAWVPHSGGEITASLR
jgi:hypothetical protein